jgi:hypothetical protein
MDCKIFELMKWYDWTNLALMYCLGIWKLIDLMRAAGKWAERKVESDRKKRDAELMNIFDKYNEEQK